MERCVRSHVLWNVDVRACTSSGRLRWRGVCDCTCYGEQMLACALARPMDGSDGKECVIARAMESRYWRARLHVLSKRLRRNGSV